MRVIHNIRKTESSQIDLYTLMIQILRNGWNILRRYGAGIFLLTVFTTIIILSLQHNKLFFEELMLACGIVCALLFFKAVKHMEELLAE